MKIIVQCWGTHEHTLIEFLHTNTYTFWRFGGDAKVFSTGTIITQLNLGDFCKAKEWTLVALINDSSLILEKMS